ncbi:MULTISPECIES: HK97 family phage prohead protease [unclassified Devosia]|jgi:HK97 family phage prohead protease|uniref:HK97 family phage prohead protease n=1 Tax=unclassified Devosia TaxID=196773 RepID=UPI001551D5C8|nr:MULTISPECIES: HK97 family phage prohead protease [unclassified Devosia]
MAAIPIDGDGRFSGYASLFGRLDGGGDIVMPGAFARSLKQRRERIRLLFQHDPTEPVGIWETIGEDSHGLFVAGRLVGGVPRADALRRLIEARALDGLSIGFRTVKATRDRPSGHRRLWQIELFEISIVTFPMLEEARIARSHELTTGAAIMAATQTLRSN